MGKGMIVVLSCRAGTEFWAGEFNLLRYHRGIVWEYH
jgi:hypothetical protein